MPEYQHVPALAVISAAALLFALYQARLPRWRNAVLAVLAVVSVAAYFNFGKFHGRTAIHYWEQFHYALSAKYFDALRYDGLYVASVLAQHEDRFYRLPPQIRDLHNDVVIDSSTALLHALVVKQRFSETQWAEFRRDNALFMRVYPEQHRNQMRKDHGFNATPFWVAMGKLALANQPITSRFLSYLVWIDPLLVALALIAVARCFNLTTAFWCSVLLGTSYAGRYFWIGGSLLRLDWLAASMLALCAARRGKLWLVGLFLAYATLQRIFPLFFLVIPALLVLLPQATTYRLKQLWPMPTTYAVGMIAGVTVGSFAGYGWHSWIDFVDHIKVHNATWLTNNIGLANLVYFDVDSYLGRHVDRSLADPWVPWHYAMDAAKAKWQWLHMLLALAVLVCTAWIARRATLVEAMLLGMLSVFAFLNLTTYYWLMLGLIPLVQRPRLVIAALLFNLAACATHFLFVMHESRYGFISWYLAAFFLYWLYLIYQDAQSQSGGVATNAVASVK